MNYVINPIVDPNFTGVITHYNEKYPTTWDKYIKIEPSSTTLSNRRYGAEALINRSFTEISNKIVNSWCSEQEDFPYFILSFPLNYISSTFYSFKARDYTNYPYYPESWYIQGSNDKKSWMNISEEYHNTMENNQSITYSFQKLGIWKHFKFIQINGTNSNMFCLQQIEIFGEILNHNPFQCERKELMISRQQISSLLLIIISFS